MHLLPSPKVMLSLATLILTFVPRVFVPCLCSLLLDLGSRDRVLGLYLYSSFGQGLLEWMGRNNLDWSYRSVTMPSYLQTDLSEFPEGKGSRISFQVCPCLTVLLQASLNSRAFVSNHSRVEREALGFSSLQVLSPQLPVPAWEVKLLPWFFPPCCVIRVKPALDLPLPLLLLLSPLF